nr:hypothetical protein CFP56_67758 [Quercus suber]
MADEEFEVDPAIAEAMGFSAFGMQSSKKRKVDQDPAGGSQASRVHGNGANSLPLGTRIAPRPEPAAETTETTETTKTNANSNLRPSEAPLGALRRGVKNERGDMVYFLPSFLEDPWKRLRQRN